MSRDYGTVIFSVAMLLGVTIGLAQQAVQPSACSGSEEPAFEEDKSHRNTETKPRSSRNQRSQNADKKPMVLTASRKAAALEFAKKHHPELAKLLVGLESRNPKAYQRAMRQLYRTSERLARLQERLPAERFEMELKLWKNESRIRLLAARISLSKKPSARLQADLKKALHERVNLRIQKLRDERARLAQKLEKLDASIRAVESNREQAAASFLKRYQSGLRLKSRTTSGKTKFVKTEKQRKTRNSRKRNSQPKRVNETRKR
ncbi:MAG: hypothetical protein Tsb009_24810 [Planctomycetaceae bacterium]